MKPSFDFALVTAITLISLTAFADFNLAAKDGAVNCSGPDNQSVTLNAKRNQIKYTVEGESQTFTVTSQETDGDTSITYIAKATKTKHGFSLTLSDQGDSFMDQGDVEATAVDCK